MPYSTRVNSTIANAQQDLFRAVSGRLKDLASPFADLDSASKELKKEMQLAYGRYVIELQHISVALALDQNLTEEEVRLRKLVKAPRLLSYPLTSLTSRECHSP